MLLVGAVLVISRASAQSNYATHSNNVGYLGEGLPEEATLDGKVESAESLNNIVLKIWFNLAGDETR